MAFLARFTMNTKRLACFSAGIAVALSAVWITAHCICVGDIFYGPPCTCF